MNFISRFLGHWFVIRVLRTLSLSQIFAAQEVFQGVLAGSHYNRAWFVHGMYAEALERLLLPRFLVQEKPHIPAILRQATTFNNMEENLMNSMNVFFRKIRKL